MVLLLAAQGTASASPTSKISGVVKDSSGNVMRGVKVHLTSPTLAATTLEAVTDEQGRYAFENVVLGSWQISFSGNGFETDKSAIKLGNAPATMNATLAFSPAPSAPQGQQAPPMPPGMQMPAGNTPPPSEPVDVGTDQYAAVSTGELTEAEISDPKALLAYIKSLEDRVKILESYSVMSIPETRTKRIEVWVDQNSNEYDHEVPGSKKVVTYQRERVFRRQDISEQIEAKLAEESEKSVAVGVSAAIMPQGSMQATGANHPADGKVYDLASADISFGARVAQNTTFYADLVGLTGPTPDSEIGGLTLLNSYTARLQPGNVISLREAWLRTEIFRNNLALIVGRLDLTSFVDRNAVANDETSQFLSDALVNNPTLGLFSNGAGVAVVYDPKKSVNFKVAFQQNDQTQLNLSKSLISLAEVGFFMTPFSLPEGNYRFWVRTDNTLGGRKQAGGVSLDQKLTDHLTYFGRAGYGFTPNNVQNGNMIFYSTGLQLQKRFVFFPGDSWAFGYAETRLTSGAAREHLGEIYYNFQLTERLKLSPRVQVVREINAATGKSTFVLPGVRLSAAF